MTGNYVATYAHEPVSGAAPGVRHTHLRVAVDMWRKGAVKVGFEVLRL
jgi:hypothetical protein